MEIKQIPIGDLKPYHKNNKKHSATQITKVANSIREFGWQQPIVCDKDNTVIIGHCRLDAAKSINLSHVPVLFAEGLTKAQIRGLRLADNKLSELGEFDFDNIKFELEELQLEGFDIELTGFDMIDFDEEKTQEQKDLSNEIKATFEIVIGFDVEHEQEEMYSELTGRGYKCRVLTL